MATGGNGQSPLKANRCLEKLRPYLASSKQALKRARKLSRVPEVQWFDEERVGPKLVGHVRFCDLIGTGEHHDVQLGKSRLMADRPQYIKPIRTWHFDVQKYECRQRVFISVAIGRLSVQIIQARCSAGKLFNRIFQARPLNGSFCEQ